MIWFVARNPDHSIAAAFSYAQPGYANEALDDASNAEIRTFRAQGAGESSSDKHNALLDRRITKLLSSSDPADQLAALDLRLSLIGG